MLHVRRTISITFLTYIATLNLALRRRITTLRICLTQKTVCLISQACVNPKPLVSQLIKIIQENVQQIKQQTRLTLVLTPLILILGGISAMQSATIYYYQLQCCLLQRLLQLLGNSRLSLILLLTTTLLPSQGRALRSSLLILTALGGLARPLLLTLSPALQMLLLLLRIYCP